MGVAKGERERDGAPFLKMERLNGVDEERVSHTTRERRCVEICAIVVCRTSARERSEVSTRRSE